MPRTEPLVLNLGDRAELERRSEDYRARILLLAADGLTHAEIARRTGVTPSTVRHWRQRYARDGLAPILAAADHSCPRCDGSTEPAPDPDELWFPSIAEGKDCPDCGIAMRVEKKVGIHGHGIAVDYRCPSCGREGFIFYDQ